MFLDTLAPFFDKKLIQNVLKVIFSPKEFTKKYFSSKFQFSAKVMFAPPGGQTVTIKLDLWSTQKYSKVSKICSAYAEIFLRLSYMLKPTVSCLPRKNNG